MTESIIVALITGGLALIGVIVTAKTSNKKSAADFQTSQAVTNTKLDELTREVREHNNFAKRMPVVEEQLRAMDSRLTKIEACFFAKDR